MFISPKSTARTSLPESFEFAPRVFTACVFVLCALPFVFPVAAMATEGGNVGPHGPIVTVLLSLVVILLAARIGAHIALRFGQPEVLGEIAVGLILGNLTLFYGPSFDFLVQDETVLVLSELGVILLLFEAGLETNVSDMLKVGLSSLLVAVLGVIAPFFLGWGVSLFFIPEAGTLVHFFVGATLCATSVGISVRVLKDIGRIQSKEAKIILGAAVIDDVLGLLILAVVSGVIIATEAGGSLEIAEIGQIFFSAFGFLFLAVWLGRLLAAKYFRFVGYLQSHGLLLAASLVVCFGFSYLASLFGLAPIVGAFTAGLILDPVHYRDLADRGKKMTIEELIAPLTSFLVPLFFVIMGAKVDLRAFGDISTVSFAAGLTVAAIIGKQICSLGVLEKDLDKIVVGFGMIPRGEVGLIFAGIGASLVLHGAPVIDTATFGAVVIMVMLTTMITPPLVKWRFAKRQ